MNNDKIEVSRELMGRLTEFWNGTDARIELRAILAAPVTERQDCPDCKVCVGSPMMPKNCPVDNGQHERQEPVGEVADMKYNRVQFYRDTGDTTKPYLLPGTKLYTAPPELAVPAAQPRCDPGASGYIQGIGERFIGKAEYDPRNGYVIPIYTSPPTPVAVALPELCESDVDDLAGSFCQEALSFGLSQDVFARLVRTVHKRTLDEVTRLNTK